MSQSYLRTQFCSLPCLAANKSRKHATRSVYAFVPIQDWTRPWTDDDALQEVRPDEGRDRVHRDR